MAYRPDICSSPPCLVVDRHVLAQDHGVLVVPVDLDVRVCVVLCRLRSVDPVDAQRARHLFGPYRLESDRLSVACHPMVSLFSNQTWAYGLLL